MRVEDVNLPGGTLLNVLVDGTQVGTITLLEACSVQSWFLRLSAVRPYLKSTRARVWSLVISPD